MTLVSKTRIIGGIVLLAGLSVLTPRSAYSQDTVRATVYGFVPNLKGTTAFPTPLGNTIDIDNGTLLDNTDLAVMGLFEVQKGRWGAWTDIMYFDLGAQKAGTRDLTVSGIPIPLPVTANANLNIDAWIVMAAGNFRAVSGDLGNLDVFGGARRIDATAALGYAFSSPFGPFAGAGMQGRTETTNANWDGIGGVRGRLRVGRVFVPYYADAGAGDSDLTWQAVAGIGYELPHVEVSAVWRHLDYRMKNDGRKIADIEFSGPTAGVTFKW